MIETLPELFKLGQGFFFADALSFQGGSNLIRYRDDSFFFFQFEQLLGDKASRKVFGVCESSFGAASESLEISGSRKLMAVAITQLRFARFQKGP